MGLDQNRKKEFNLRNQSKVDPNKFVYAPFARREVTLEIFSTSYIDVHKLPRTAIVIFLVLESKWSS